MTDTHGEVCPRSRGGLRPTWICSVLGKEHLSLFWYSAHPNKEGISSPERQKEKTKKKKEKKNRF